MASKIISIRDSDDSEEITSINWGIIDKGSSSSELTIRIWNNYGGASNTDDATSCVLAVKTYLNLNTGDTVANGQEVVTEKFVSAKCTSRGDTTFTPIGGTTTLPIGYTSGSQVLSGNISTPANQAATVILKFTIPSDAEASSITCKLGVYSI